MGLCIFEGQSHGRKNILAFFAPKGSTGIKLKDTQALLQHKKGQWDTGVVENGPIWLPASVSALLLELYKQILNNYLMEGLCGVRDWARWPSRQTFQNWEKEIPVVYKLPSQWYFVIAAWMD